MDEADAYAPRFWSQSRDDALTAVAGLLFGRNSHTVRRDCLEIIISKPQILNQLLSMFSVDRSPWHPEAKADAIAARILTHLLMPPHLWIPELSESTFSSPSTRFPPGHHSDNDNAKVEWNAAVSCWEIFVKLRKWREILLEKWKKLQTETREDILR
jgi:hypothetical protein